MSKVVSRLLTFFIGIPLVILFCVIDFQNYLPLSIIAVLASLISSIEFYKMLSNKTKLFNPVIIVTFASILPAAVYIFTYLNKAKSLNIDLNYTAWILCAEIIILMGIESFKSKTFEESIERISFSALILFYCGFLCSAFLRFITIPNTTIVLIIFFLLVFMCDSAAWFFGVLFGKKTRGVVAVSPNKSLVGFIGGIAGSIAIGCILKLLFPEVLFGAWWKTILLSFATALAAIVGDLIESVFKRSCGVKDSGYIIPGRGGLLDSLDSIFAAAPIVYLGFHFLF